VAGIDAVIDALFAAASDTDDDAAHDESLSGFAGLVKTGNPAPAIG
jgi:hypothetical protein